MGLGFQTPTLDPAQQSGLDAVTGSTPDNVLRLETTLPQGPYEWQPGFNTAYVSHSYENLYNPSPIVTSHEGGWHPVNPNYVSPVSATSAPQQTFWNKPLVNMDGTLALSYPQDLSTLVPVSDAVSPYMPYPTSTSDWDQSSIQSATPILVKAEMSSPVSTLDGQPLYTALNMHAKSSYIDAYWEYFHPLFPILHKPTMEQQRQIDPEQSNSSLLLQAAMMICGATFTNEETRRTDGKMLLRRALKQLQQVRGPGEFCNCVAHNICRSTRSPRAMSTSCKQSSCWRRTLNSTINERHLKSPNCSPPRSIRSVRMYWALTCVLIGVAPA
ncbi:MAG: hypothetical protein INR71_04550 [Terriglobus roseus]|nr:hypothetical protein [Terriglobus roseus]